MLVLSPDAMALGHHHDHDVSPIPTIVPTPTEYQTAGDNGFRALWVVFAGMILSSLVFTFLSWKIPVNKRLYHVITTLVTLTAAVSYFAMASGDATAFSCHRVKDHHSEHIPSTHHHECRQIFWARYVDWSITTPLLILDLCLLAGVSGAHTAMAIVADLIMILGGLFAAFGREHTAQKWGWYTIGCLGYVFVLWHLGVNGYRAGRERHAKVGKLFGSLAGFTIILWTIYPIIWALGEGTHKISVDSEIIGYAILDVLAKPVFGLWLLIAHRSIPETNVDLGGYWAHGLGGEGRILIGEDDA